MLRLSFIIALICSSCVTNRPVEDYGRITANALFDNGQGFKGHGASGSVSYNWVVDQERQIWFGPEYSLMWSRGITEAENTISHKTAWEDVMKKNTHLLGARLEFGNRTAFRFGAVYEDVEIKRNYKDFYNKTPAVKKESHYGYYIGLQNDLPLSKNIFLTPAITFYTLDGQANAAMEFGVTLGF